MNCFNGSIKLQLFIKVGKYVVLYYMYTFVCFESGNGVWYVIFSWVTRDFWITFSNPISRRSSIVSFLEIPEPYLFLKNLSYVFDSR